MAGVPSPITQTGRLLSISITTLDFDTLLIESFTGEEGISRPFRFVAELLADVQFGRDQEVRPEELIGEMATIRIALPKGGFRYINGVIRRFTKGLRDGRFMRYRAEIVPWLSWLTLRSDCRIFQDKTVPQILELIFEKLRELILEELDSKGKGHPEMIQYRFDLAQYRPDLPDKRRVYIPWDYCVQYRETDFNFVSRLMEAEGIFYYFEHEEQKHTLVLVDKPVNCCDCPEQSEVYLQEEAPKDEREDTIVSCELSRSLYPGQTVLRDYHFELPDDTLEVPESTMVPERQSEVWEVFDYPGDYAQKFNKPGQRLGDVKAEGKTLVRLRMEEEETGYVVLQGVSYCRAFMPGYTFSVLSRAWEEMVDPFLLTHLEHSGIQSPSYVSDEQVLGAYKNRFTGIPAAMPFRPPRLTPKPVVRGPQTAVVVGRSKEEIHPDKYGRIKVQFHWDRQGALDDRSSCWVRVAQLWAGNRWGAMFIPRVGQEVVVDFLEGDPDRPIVIGCVYNQQNEPHYDLPHFQTLSYIKSNSSKGGKGFNELRFEDKKDQEQVFIHSQRRMDVRVRQSFYETNFADRHVRIGWEKDGQQGGNYELTVKGNNDVHIGKARFEAIDEKLNQAIKQDAVYDLQNNQATMVKIKSELNARQITIEGLQKITLKVGSSFVVLDLTGVTIQGPMVKINSGGSAAPVQDAQIEDPLDAAAADTGEPGYLERLALAPRRPRVRNRRTLQAQHGPDVTRDADGNYRVGRGVIVDGSDSDFAQAALADVALINTTPRGREMLQSIDDSGRTVTIRRRTPDPSDPDWSPMNAEAWPGGGPGVSTTQDFIDATPNGQPVYYGDGSEALDAHGNQYTGFGIGSDSTVLYDPSVWPGDTKVPSDSILEHEMGHADHMTNGTYDGTPEHTCFDTMEEVQTITEENEYRSQRQPPVHQRTDHKDL